MIDLLSSPHASNLLVSNQAAREDVFHPVLELPMASQRIDHFNSKQLCGSAAAVAPSY